MTKEIVPYSGMYRVRNGMQKMQGWNVCQMRRSIASGYMRAYLPTGLRRRLVDPRRIHGPYLPGNWLYVWPHR